MAGKARGTKPRKGKANRRRRKSVGRWLAFAAKWTATVAVWAVLAVIGVSAWYAYDLPDVEKALQATRRPTLTLLAADGSEVVTFGKQFAGPVQIGALPAALPEAVLATEDRRFYDHFGLDVIGLGRAVVANLQAGRVVEGGSTITQQVAKNLFLTPERTIKRKIQELLLALWLERKLSKDQILTVYLNRVYLGAGTYGVEAAARRYFGRSARQVSLYQAAMLAGLLKAPSRYNPAANPALAAKRTRRVLANMVAAGYLKPAEAAAAAHKGATGAKARPARRPARHFADWVAAQVPAYVTPGDRDLIIVTTLDARQQRQAEDAVARMLKGPAAAARVSEAALVALAPDGAVNAMVGGRDYRKSQFNRATQARRQPGSAFKPFVYLAALEAGLTPETRLTDGPVVVDGWSPRNFSRRHLGEISLGDALARSVNTVAVTVAEWAGRQRVIDTAHRLGIGAELQPTPSLALGAAEVSLMELTTAYAPFANGGIGVWAYGITEIRDDAGRVLYRRHGSGTGRVVEPGHVAAMNGMLAEVVATGTGRAAALARPAAGKTGTSQNFRDAWFVGYSAELITGVWLGNDDGRPMGKVTGGGLPARLWRDFMKAAHAGVAPQPLPGLGSKPRRDDEQGFWRSLVAHFTGGG